MKSEILEVAARKAGLIDLDWLKLVDGKDDGTKGADEVIAALREAKPYLFQPKARDMTPEQRATKLAEIKRGQPPAEPMPVDVRASDMTATQRSQWISEHARRTR
jgi:hypothetical protein